MVILGTDVFSYMIDGDNVNMCEWYVNKYNINRQFIDQYNIRKWEYSKVTFWLVDRFNIDKNELYNAKKKTLNNLYNCYKSNKKLYAK